MNAAQKTQIATVEHDDGNPILSMIERAARDPSMDVDKLERLMAMHERAESKRAEAAFNDALNLAQSEIGTVGVNKTNNQTHSSYATYEKLDIKLRPIYIKHGFALSFDTADGAREGCIRVVCYVSHKAGHTRRYQADMPADGKGAKGNDVMTKTHAAGSAMSYGMRYLLKMIFNVAVGEQDDDGNAASQTGFDSTAWLDSIANAGDKLELDRIAEQIRGAGIPAQPLRNIRAAWAAKAKEFAK